MSVLNRVRNSAERVLQPLFWQEMLRIPPPYTGYFLDLRHAFVNSYKKEATMLCVF